MSKKHQQKQQARTRAKRLAARRQVRTRNRFVGAIVGGIVLIALIVGVWWMVGRDAPAEDSAAAESAPSAPAASPAPTETSTSAFEPCPVPGDDAPTADTEVQFDAPPPADLSDTIVATIETTCGTIVAELDADAAPQTVSSFAFLAEEGFYDGVPFHRIGADFVIQGGDPTGTGSGGPGYSIDDELDLAQQVVAENNDIYPRGTLAMANSGANTNGSQFFVVQADPGYPFDPAYTVFGMVTEGMDIVDRIATGPVTGDRNDQAVDPTLITSVTIAPA